MKVEGGNCGEQVVHCYYYSVTLSVGRTPHFCQGSARSKVILRQLIRVLMDAVLSALSTINTEIDLVFASWVEDIREWKTGLKIFAFSLFVSWTELILVSLAVISQ